MLTFKCTTSISSLVLLRTAYLSCIQNKKFCEKLTYFCFYKLSVTTMKKTTGTERLNMNLTKKLYLSHILLTLANSNTGLTK